MRKTGFFVAVLLLFSSGAVFAAGGANVLVSNIKDTRSTNSFFSKCEVEIKLTGDAVSRAEAVRVLRLTEAVDDTGLDVINPEEFPQKINFKGKGKSGAEVTLELKNPSRRAGEIKRLAGELELYSPSTDEEAMLVVDGFMKHTGQPLKDKRLEDAGVSVLILTKEQNDELTRKQKEEEEAKAKAAEAREEQAEEGDETGDEAKEAADVMDAMAKAFLEAFKGMFGGLGTRMDQNSLKVLIDDPGDRLVEVQFQDAQGKKLSTNWWSGEIKNRIISFNALPPDDARLVIYLSTKKSMKTVPFEVKNIPLP
jgi:hypothetical protein